METYFYLTISFIVSICFYYQIIQKKHLAKELVQPLNINNRKISVIGYDWNMNIAFGSLFL